MDELKTIQFILYKDRIEMKGKETNSIYTTWYFKNFEKNFGGNMLSLFYEMSTRQKDGLQLEFINYIPIEE